LLANGREQPTDLIGLTPDQAMFMPQSDAVVIPRERPTETWIDKISIAIIEVTS
jgi:hypothetical protein